MLAFTKKHKKYLNAYYLEITRKNIYLKRLKLYRTTAFKYHKIMKYILLKIMFIVCISTSYGQQFSKEAKQLAQDGIEYRKNNDYYNGKIKFEKLLDNYSSEFSYAQIKTVKSVLINCYYEISMAKGQQEDPNFKDYCLKGIVLCTEINQKYNLDAFMFHYMMIVHYCFLENKTQMYNWINKINVIKNHLSCNDEKLKDEMIKWSNNNIRIMKNTFNYSSSSKTHSFSFGDLISESSSSNMKPITTYNKSTSKKVVKRTEKCCVDTKLDDKVIIYWAHTNKGEKISLYYYPHLDKWHFKNGWGEKFRGNKFYTSLEKIIEVIECE